MGELQKKIVSLDKKMEVEEQDTYAVLIGSDSEMLREVFSLSNASQLT